MSIRDIPEDARAEIARRLDAIEAGFEVAAVFHGSLPIDRKRE